MANKVQSVIRVKNLKKSYKDNQVLRGINFEVEKGTMLALLGPNGAGKTTTVRILSTLLGFDKGTVTIGGFDVQTHADDVRRSIGLTGQSAAVDELLTGRENLVMMGRAVSPDEAKRSCASRRTTRGVRSCRRSKPARKNVLWWHAPTT